MILRRFNREGTARFGEFLARCRETPTTPPPTEMLEDPTLTSLEAQARVPLFNRHPVEMGFDAAHGGLGALTARLNGLDYYRELFAFVYGDSTVTVDRIQRAIAQYVRAMASS